MGSIASSFVRNRPSAVESCSILRRPGMPVRIASDSPSCATCWQQRFLSRSIRSTRLPPSTHVLGVAQQSGRKGVQSLILLTAGFAEVGPEGQRRQSELLA